MSHLVRRKVGEGGPRGSAWVRRSGLAALVAASILAPAPAPAAAAPGDEAAFRGLLDRYSPAIVRIEAVLRTKLAMGGEGEEQDSRLDLMGVVIDPGGLIMIWNSQISSSRMNEIMADMGRGEGFQVDVTPQDFKFYWPASGKEARAFLAASDSTLDLAFLQLDERPAEPLSFVDLSDARSPRVGETVVGLSRLGRSFDYAPFFASARVAGELRKPRHAFVLDGDLPTFGLPVFDVEGRPVGALTTVYSPLGDQGDAGFLGSFLPMMSGGSGPAGGPVGVFVLPGERVVTIVELARTEARKLLETRRRQREEAGAR